MGSYRLYRLYSTCYYVCFWTMSCLLNAEAEVEQAVRGVWLPTGSFHFIDEATESITQLSSGAPKNILLQLHGTCCNQDKKKGVPQQSKVKIWICFWCIMPNLIHYIRCINSISRLTTEAWLLQVGLSLPPLDPSLPGVNSILTL